VGSDRRDSGFDYGGGGARWHIAGAVCVISPRKRSGPSPDEISTPAERKTFITRREWVCLTVGLPVLLRQHHADVASAALSPDQAGARAFAPAHTCGERAEGIQAEKVRRRSRCA
jgi:hypothetical protein